MKTWLSALLLPAGLFLMFSTAVWGQGFPRCTAVDPETAKTGDMVNITCANVDKSTVADLYLTDGKADTKIAVMDRTEDKIKFQVPAKLKPGRYHVAFLTANKSSMVEQPVVLTVE
ncbi:MAG TPA: hypothetical protein VFW44_21360 [Bryobacteraceae bacterium]|nr:hypothetical protein [Bryobacteraceae bacterium]